MRKLQCGKKGKKRVSAVVMAALLIASMTACGSTAEADATQDVKDMVGASAENTASSEVVDQESADAEKSGDEQQADPAQNGFPEGMMQGDQYIGEITAIDGNTITVEASSMNRSLGEMPEGMNPGEKPDGEAPEGAETLERPSGESGDGKAPEKPDGGNFENQSQGEKPRGEAPEGMESGAKPDGEAPEGMEPGTKPDSEVPEGMEPGTKPDGEATEGMEAGERPDGEVPEGMESGARPDGANFADMPRETMTIEITEDTVITVNGESATVENLQVGDSIMFTMDEDVVTNISVGMMEAVVPDAPQQETAE